MIINTRKDLDNAPEDVRNSYLIRLASGINRWNWDGNDWELYQDTNTIQRFDYQLSDFPDAPIPPKPDYNPDEREAKQEALKQIANLKSMLRDTDYVSLPDYDKDKPEVLAQRADWRAEIRQLEKQYGVSS